jgi:protein required for attachment to host cells
MLKGYACRRPAGLRGLKVARPHGTHGHRYAEPGRPLARHQLNLQAGAGKEHGMVALARVDKRQHLSPVRLHHSRSCTATPERAVARRRTAMKNWLVVANAARARVLEEGDKPGAYIHRADLVHPQSRLKGIELGGDRPGHVVRTGHGLGSTAYAPHTDSREREHDRFAQELAEMLNHGIAAGQCAGLVLVASNPFLGHLKAHLGEQAHKAILRTVPADYTALRDDELAPRLDSNKL